MLRELTLWPFGIVYGFPYLVIPDTSGLPGFSNAELDSCPYMTGMSCDIDVSRQMRSDCCKSVCISYNVLDGVECFLVLLSLCREA